MGCTLEASDTPWPVVLEKMIADRLKLSRPVQVLNAGVQAYSLEENLIRLADDILPLKPDLIVSYHGYNGFMYINNGLPPVRFHQPPRFIDRPIYLLARCEYHLRWLFYLRQHRQTTAVPPLPEHWRDGVLDSPLARKYEELIAVAKTNGISLALADFNLAVSARSDPDVIEFYRSVFPQVHEIVQANDANTWLLGQLARRHPEVLYVHAQTNLHGIHSKFIDLVHLTQDGRRQLAENIFEGIRGVIPQGLAAGSDAH
jgi:lysophospholipase L1-like esterase